MSRIAEIYDTINPDWVTIEVVDMMNESHYMDVKQIDLDAYQDGALIQDAFPYLTNKQRELILTGLTDDIWNTPRIVWGDMFPNDDEE